MLTALAVLLSCEKEDNKPVSVSVSPEQLTVPCTLSDQTFEVVSDGGWTVNALSTDSLEVSWVRIGRKQGIGNMPVSVRVLPNDFNNQRTAMLTVVSESGNKAVVELVQEPNTESKESNDNLTLRIGNYNIRVVTSADKDENAWENRRTRLVQSIRDCEFDVFGINEWSLTSQTYLQEQLKNTYDFQVFSPYSQAGTGDNAMGVGYRKDFTLLEWNYFWLSDTPDIIAENNDGSSTRGGCCGLFVHNDTGIKFFVMVHHGALDDALRDGKASLFAEMEKKYNPEGYPSFFVGDMNAYPESEASVTYREYWNDTYLTVSEAYHKGPMATYNAFDLDRDMYTNKSRLDYIYYRNAEPLNYVCNDAKYAGYYASDHLPIYSDMKITITK